MRILIDITHPAFFHFFKYAIRKLKADGHDLCLTGRDKDVLRSLAEENGFELKYFGGDPASFIGKLILLIRRKIWLADIIKQFHPDVLVSCAGPFIAILGKILRIPTLVFYDVEHDTFSNSLTYPFATRIYTPECYLDRRVPRNYRYAGYHSLAYTHPNHFTPDPHVKTQLGVQPDESYSIVRFVGWRAGHDIGYHGLTIEQKIQAVKELEKYGRVFISSESHLPKEVENYRFPLASSRMLDALAFASILYGESTAMASEAAVLGVPSVLIYPLLNRGSTKEQSEKWKIVHWYTTDEFDAALAKGIEILRKNETDHWKNIGREIVESSVDVTDFICEQILTINSNV